MFKTPLGRLALCALFVSIIPTASSLPVWAEQAQGTVAIAIEPSQEKYVQWMQTGRKIKAELVGNYSQYKAMEGIQAFNQAAQFAPTLLQRAETSVEAGELLYDMALFPQALGAFSGAIKENLNADFKGRALIGIAHSAYRFSELRKTLKADSPYLRANYDAALKARKLTDEQMQEVWDSLAIIAVAEGKPLEAARQYLHILETSTLRRLWPFKANDAIREIKTLENPSPTQQVEAVALLDKIYKVYLPLRKEDGTAHYVAALLEYANLLDRFDQQERAVTLRAEIASDEAVEPTQRAKIISQIAAAHVERKEYDKATQALDGLNKLPGDWQMRHQLELARILLAQGKLTEAGQVTVKVQLATPTPDEKLESFWIMADITGEEIKVLRQKSSSEPEIATKLASQKRQLTIAQLQSEANVELRREAMLKLAQWETENGTKAEAAKWKTKAANLRANFK